MKVALFPIGRLRANCCVAFEKDGSAAVIDPGGDPSPVIEYMEKNKLRCEAILLTHGHDDHTQGVRLLKEQTGAPLYIGRGDAYRLDLPADQLLNGGEELVFGGLRIEVIPAPGHTEGGMCYYSDGVLFAGDTLFRESVGRTDLPGGSWDELERSLSALTERFSQTDTAIIPGHGMITDFRHEMEHNAYL